MRKRSWLFAFFLLLALWSCGDGIGPDVIVTTPDNLAEDVKPNSYISIYFDEDVDVESLSAIQSGSDCAGSVLLSSDNFKTCVPMHYNSTKDDNLLFFYPLEDLEEATVYTLKIDKSINDPFGNDMLETVEITFTTEGDVTIPTVSSVTPANSATGVAVDTSISVTFSETMNTNTLTTSTNGNCTGAIQVSSDGFENCVAMTAVPSASNSNQTFTVTPSASFSGETTYKVKVTGAEDSAGNTVTDVIQENGFTTADVNAPTVISFSPADTATGVAVGTDISVTFSEAMDASTLTASSTDCSSGSIQVSADNFSTCLETSAPSADSAKKIFTVTPSSALSGETSYKIRVTTGAADASGNSHTSTTTQVTGFTTADVSAPSVSSITPADSATGIAVDTDIVIIFNEKMDVSTVTTSTDGSCLGATIQVSSNNFSTCVQMEADPVASNSEQTFTLAPSIDFSSETIYKVKVTTGAKDSSGNSVTETAQGTGFTTADVAAPTVTSISPDDAATDVAELPTVQINFSEEMKTSSLTVNTDDTSCSGSIQISSDGFDNCVRMGALSFSNSNQRVETTPVSNLTRGTTYKVKLTTNVQDEVGNSLAELVQANGFTVIADETAPLVSSITPANSDTGVIETSSIVVVFNEAMKTSTITTSTDGSCSNTTIQVSSDDFSTCVQMEADPVASNSDQTFTVTPDSPLSFGETYKVKITTGVQDTSSNALAADSIQANGFTVVEVLQFHMSSAGTQGKLNGSGNERDYVDGLCSGAQGSLSNTRAVISLSGGDHVNDMPTEFVDMPDRRVVWIGTNNTIADNWADLWDGSIDLSLADAGAPANIKYWMGSNTDGTEDGGENCGGWNSTNSNNNAAVGDSDALNGGWIKSGTLSCDNNLKVLCVAW